MKRLRICAGAAGLALLSLSSRLPAQGPIGRKCPTGAALKLDQVTGLIANGVPEDHIIEVIGVCHVGFSMDPAALEKLSAAGVSNAVLDALNRETISRMSLAAAHAEVAVLEERERSNEASVNAARDAAIRKSDVEYKTRRDQAAYIRPKTIYDKTVDYDALVQKAQDNVAAMDRSHEAEKAQIAQQFAAGLARKDEYLDRRIASLKGGIYSDDSGSPVFVTYDADNSRLTVMIAGEEFWFTAEPLRAKAMNDHWNSLKVMQGYEDGETRDRFLVESADLQPILGAPSAIVKRVEQDKQIAALLRAAHAAYAARDYKQARDLYNRILDLDANNKEANEGINADPVAASFPTPNLPRQIEPDRSAIPKTGQFVCAGVVIMATRAQPNRPMMSAAEARTHDRLVSAPLKITTVFPNASGLYFIQVEGDSYSYYLGDARAQDSCRPNSTQSLARSQGPRVGQFVCAGTIIAEAGNLNTGFKVGEKIRIVALDQNSLGGFKLAGDSKVYVVRSGRRPQDSCAK